MILSLSLAIHCPELTSNFLNLSVQASMYIEFFLFLKPLGHQVNLMAFQTPSL